MSWRGIYAIDWRPSPTTSSAATIFPLPLLLPRESENFAGTFSPPAGRIAPPLVAPPRPRPARRKVSPVQGGWRGARSGRGAATEALRS